MVMSLFVKLLMHCLMEILSFFAIGVILIGYIVGRCCAVAVVKQVILTSESSCIRTFSIRHLTGLLEKMDFMRSFL